jgi:hypothetical protein
MENLTKFANKYGMLIIIILFFMTLMKTCSISNDISALKKSQRRLEIEFKSVPKRIEYDMKIEGLKISKRTLYDWNSIVRTVQRPDDVIKKYDDEINQFEKMLANDTTLHQ